MKQQYLSNAQVWRYEICLFELNDSFQLLLMSQLHLHKETLIRMIVVFRTQLATGAECKLIYIRTK